MKRLWLLLSAVVLLTLAFYVFMVPYEFKVTLRANTLPGDVIQTIRIWDRSLANSQIVNVDSLSTLTQKISIEGRSYIYRWAFNVKGDSVTTIQVGVSEPDRRFLNKILVPFSAPPIEEDAAKIMHGFHDILQEHLQITRVKFIGEAVLDPSFCVCSALATRQVDKANGMMKDFPELTDFISITGLKPKGPPSVRIKNWDHNKGELKYDFCFPIHQRDTLPRSKKFTYSSFDRQRALKAEYYGNYITSDRAWYVLIQEAVKKGYDVKGLPVEFFHNNPNLGSNESAWKADVYLPIE